MTATVATPLRAEYAALRELAPNLVRTGMGRARSAAHSPNGPLLIAGVAGALTDDLRPGEIVVATELLGGPDGAIPVPSAPLLASALRRLGLTVHCGPILTVPGVLHGAAARREAAARTGAIAVDTESAYLAGSAAHPVAAVRSIVDTPGAPLLRPGTIHRGLGALRSLRRAAPAIRDWLAATGDRTVVLAAPRSFCAGVDRAIEIVERALDRYGAPVYVRRQVVHNAHVVRQLEERGAVFVEEVEQVPPGALVVLAAHGVAPSVRAAAAARELTVVDATCPLVSKVHSEVRRHSGRGQTVFLIGHADHEEVVGTVGEAPEHVVVVEDAAAAATVVAADPGRVAYAMQTTLAVDEAEQVAGVLRERFPTLTAPRRDDICYATTNRQAALREVAARTDLVLVVGSTNSSNSLRLVEVAERAGTPARLVDDAGEVELGWLAGKARIGVTAGASAPPHLVDDLVRALGGLGEVDRREAVLVEEDVRFALPREVS
jgi:4-hydroxy-3-methylbut-2-en-1-yl diphosphate reductase